MDSHDMEYLWGGLLFLGSTFVSALFIAPYAQSLVSLFAFAGAYASLLFGGILGFFVLSGFLIAARHFGVKSAIPGSEEG
jgi:hypothetical protein